MLVQNFVDGYIKVKCKHKTFVVGLSNNIKKLIEVKEINHEYIIAMCEMFNGSHYIRWIPLGIQCLKSECLD